MTLFELVAVALALAVWIVEERLAAAKAELLVRLAHGRLGDA